MRRGRDRREGVMPVMVRERRRSVYVTIDFSTVGDCAGKYARRELLPLR